MPGALLLTAIGTGLLAPHPAAAGILSLLARLFTLGEVGVEEEFPAIVPLGQAVQELSALDAGNRPPFAAEGEGTPLPLPLVQGNALVASLNPLGTPPPADGRATGQIFVYTIRPGDSLAAVAQSFDVSVNTIRWANNISDLRALKAGDRLLILPVTGVKHEVKAGDTIAAIAKKYRASIDDILQFNGLAPDEALAAGATVIVPDGELSIPVPLGPPPFRAFSTLPSYDGFYVRPIAGGRRSRDLHGYNGIDLASSCGLPVVASAEGEVLVARPSGWNGGYGRYVVIAHPNRTQTLYAHLRDVTVAPGGSVRRGEIIGSIGSSGNSTGCHVHFEVRGARNPF